MFGGRLAWLRGAWRRGAAIPVLCRETASELVRVLGYPKFHLDAAERDALLGEYLPFAEASVLPADLPALPSACRDRDDTVFILLALAASADILVSGDRDVTSLRSATPIPVMTAGDFRDFLNGQDKTLPKE